MIASIKYHILNGTMGLAGTAVIEYTLVLSNSSQPIGKDITMQTPVVKN